MALTVDIKQLKFMGDVSRTSIVGFVLLLLGGLAVILVTGLFLGVVITAVTP